MPDTAKGLNNTSIRNQIVKLVDRMPEDMQVKLLQYLQARLPMRIRGRLVNERRADARRDCLMNLEYRIDGRSFEGFILDINAFGIFVESDGRFPTDKSIQLRFSLPGFPTQLNLSGRIVWSGAHGFGVKFESLKRDQIKMIQSFSNQEESIYTIDS